MYGWPVLVIIVRRQNGGKSRSGSLANLVSVVTAAPNKIGYFRPVARRARCPAACPRAFIQASRRVSHTHGAADDVVLLVPAIRQIPAAAQPLLRTPFYLKHRLESSPQYSVFGDSSPHVRVRNGAKSDGRRLRRGAKARRAVVVVVPMPSEPDPAPSPSGRASLVLFHRSPRHQPVHRPCESARRRQADRSWLSV